MRAESSITMVTTVNDVHGYERCIASCEVHGRGIGTFVLLVRNQNQRNSDVLHVNWSGAVMGQNGRLGKFSMLTG